MKPFDLQKALAGEPVVTRGGLVADQFHRFNAPKSGHPVRCVINGAINSFTDCGQYYQGGQSHPHDLFMATKKRTVYVNLARSGSGSWGYSVEQAVLAAQHADALMAKPSEYIAFAVPVEIEE